MDDIEEVWAGKRKRCLWCKKLGPGAYMQYARARHFRVAGTCWSTFHAHVGLHLDHTHTHTQETHTHTGTHTVQPHMWCVHLNTHGKKWHEPRNLDMKRFNLQLGRHNKWTGDGEISWTYYPTLQVSLFWLRDKGMSWYVRFIFRKIVSLKIFKLSSIFKNVATAHIGSRLAASAFENTANHGC